MQSQNSLQQATPKQALLTLRIIWGAMLMGILVFSGVVLAIMNPDSAEPQPMFLYISIGMFLSTIPVGYFMRMTAYKQGWEANRIKPGSYATGNIILFATIEAPVFASLIFTMIQNQWGWHSLPAALGVLLFLINFPTGKPMMDTPSEYETAPEDSDDGVIKER